MAITSGRDARTQLPPKKFFNHSESHLPSFPREVVIFYHLLEVGGKWENKEGEKRRE